MSAVRTQTFTNSIVGRFNPNPIFVVDDNTDYANLLAQLLQAWKVPNQVRHFADGLAVIEYLKTCVAMKSPRCPVPALLFLDLRMPKVGGLEVLAWLKDSDLSYVPVIAVSGTPSWSDVATAYKLGAEFFIGKCHETELRDKVNAVLSLPPRVLNH